MASLILSVDGKKPNRETLLTIKVKCPVCERKATFTIWEDNYRRVMNGETLHYTPEDIAKLKTGICHSCYFKS